MHVRPRRTARPFVGGDYFRGISVHSAYISHPQFATDTVRYVRAFLLLQNDLLLFDYNEPADQNCDCYSFRAHEILLRASIEVEANCKAILVENGYKKIGKKARDLTVDDYKKIEFSHRLSGFQVKIPNWHGNLNTRMPFASSAAAQAVSPQWYRASHDSPHSQMAPNICAKRGWAASIWANRSMSGSRRKSVMFGMSS